MNGDVRRILLERATPLVYRSNAFRVLRLSVLASGSDVRRACQQARARRPNETPKADGVVSSVFDLDPLPDEAACERAAQRLPDPAHRIVEELFWFWPMKVDDPVDDALDALHAGDWAAATDAWSSPPYRSVGSHNMAVLSHLRALDIATSDQEKEADILWEQAYTHWTDVLGGSPFWSRVGERITMRDDPRLSPAAADDLRSGLPLALLSINASLALAAAENGDGATARRQLAIIGTSGFDVDLIDEAMVSILDPAAERLRTLCANSLAEATDETHEANGPTRRLIEESGRVLEAVDLLLPSGHPLRDALHDEVALAVLDCSYQYAKATEDWDHVRSYEHTALNLAVGQAARGRIYEQNLMWTECWFCRTQPRADGADVAVAVSGPATSVEDGDTEEVRWTRQTVYVPRCAACLARERGGIAYRRWIRGLTALIFVTAVAGTAGTGGSGRLMLPLMAAVCFRVGAWIVEARLVADGRIDAADDTTLVEGESDPRTAESFPLVVDLLAEPGWALGREPQT